jgi:anti-anti-sigma factor
MTATRFEATARRAGDLAIIDLHGEVNRESEPALSQAYSQAVDGGSHDVRLDFSRVDYINSTGIAVIVGLLAQARRDGRTVQAIGLSEHYREIFDITRLSEFITILDDEGPASDAGTAS